MRKEYENVDFHKYDRNPIPDNVPDIRKEINKLREEDKDVFLSEIEHQLILDRIIACEDKIKAINSSNIKLTPVLGTFTIKETKANARQKKYSLTESKLLL